MRSKKQSVSRRDFLGRAALVAALTAVGPKVWAVASNEPSDISDQSVNARQKGANDYA